MAVAPDSSFSNARSVFIATVVSTAPVIVLLQRSQKLSALWIGSSLIDIRRESPSRRSSREGRELADPDRADPKTAAAATSAATSAPSAAASCATASSATTSSATTSSSAASVAAPSMSGSKPYAACSGHFLVEDKESRQADVRDFLLSEYYRCGVLRRPTAGGQSKRMRRPPATTLQRLQTP